MNIIDSLQSIIGSSEQNAQLQKITDKFAAERIKSMPLLAALTKDIE